MKISKNVREVVRKKYNGKCAYCGTDLPHGWNVDHIKPLVMGGTNDLENLNPACKECNNYKCYCDLEEYRKQLYKLLNEKPEYLFKSKTKMQVATNMGTIQYIKWNGKFYFETITI
jgi:5-methylcytosine-specific restriction endonuclease McrA